MSKPARLPFLNWIADYRKEWARFDVIAGLTAAAVVVPKAMAYATIAGLPVQIGLYTAIVPMLVYALLGTSRPPRRPPARRDPPDPHRDPAGGGAGRGGPRRQRRRAHTGHQHAGAARRHHA